MVGIPFNAATAAYGNAQRLINQAAKPQADLTAMTGSSGGDSAFGQMLAQSVQDVVVQGNASEQLSMGMLTGKADMVDVVTAMSQAELAMETMVTVRDKVIAAYEEIMRMPI